MYSKIQDGKKKGFTREAVSRHLDLSWATVDKYWDMTVKEYESLPKHHINKLLAKYEAAISGWLKEFPDLSSAQIKDWIEENYSEKFAERTVREYVVFVRNKYDIPKMVQKQREYGTCPELPPGRQLQADFGVYNAVRPEKSRIRLYLVVFILAHSRYKYILWQLRPFKTLDFVRCLESCFEAFGGCPQELVIDQDTLMTVSENSGDIIHTHEFERCKNRHGFSVWLCRKSDPQSKGYVKTFVM